MRNETINKLEQKAREISELCKLEDFPVNISMEFRPMDESLHKEGENYNVFMISNGSMGDFNRLYASHLFEMTRQMLQGTDAKGLSHRMLVSIALGRMEQYLTIMLEETEAEEKITEEQLTLLDNPVGEA